jgi:IS4 transposase
MTTIGEWPVLEQLLPKGWGEAARTLGAFFRARYLKTPGEVLRLLLTHAAGDGGPRVTVAQARIAGLPSMSQVALRDRLRESVGWLEWMIRELSESRLRRDAAPEIAGGLRPRLVDGTTVQGPGAKGTEWRLHCGMDLKTLTLDWFELTDAREAEALERMPVSRGDVLLADRNYLRPASVRAVADAGGFVLVRLRWTHSRMSGDDGQPVHALNRVRSLFENQAGDWPVRLDTGDGQSVAGRIVALKLPGPLAEKAVQRAIRRGKKKRRTPDPRSIEAARYVMLFTTVPAEHLPAENALELYRFRWQIEVAFKRLKQLLKAGHLPHKDRQAAAGWIQAKLLLALLMELLYRNSRSFSPWGYEYRSPGV